MTLSAGSIAFLGASTQQTDGFEYFAFIALEDIGANTKISFTERPVASLTTSTVGLVEWISNQTVSAGTIVEIGVNNTAATTATQNIGTATKIGTTWNFAGSDAIHAFTGSVDFPNFLTAISFNNAPIASSLTAGVNAVSLPTVNNNSAIASINAVTSDTNFATPALARAAFNNAGNWISDTSNTANPGGGTAPEIPFLTDLQSTLLGQGSIAICYLAGTHIRTPAGECTVETLAIGDEVVTIDGIQRIRWIGRHSYSAKSPGPWVTPIRIQAHAFGQGAPHRELVVSPWHAILFDDVMVRAKDLVNGDTITQAFPGPVAHYFNIEFDDPTVVYAEGVAAETYANHENRHMFANAAEYAALYGDDERVMVDADGNYLRRFPLVLDGPKHEAARQKAIRQPEQV